MWDVIFYLLELLKSNVNNVETYATFVLDVSCSSSNFWTCRSVTSEGSLLDDFDHWFRRGEELLSCCPTSVMTPEEQQRFRARLEEGQQAIAATRALVAASTAPMAVSMDAMTPWHGLVTEVWSLSAKVAAARR